MKFVKQSAFVTRCGGIKVLRLHVLTRTYTDTHTHVHTKAFDNDSMKLLELDGPVGQHC